MKKNSILVICLMLMTMFACKKNQNPTQMVIINAKIWTGSTAKPWAEAMVVDEGRIKAIGTTSEIRKYILHGTKVIDAQQNLIVPGFIDAHLHFIEAGAMLTQVQLREAKTPEEFIQKIKLYAQTLKSGEWILGGNWDHTLWGGKMPDKSWIDSVTPNNPVWVNRLDGHMALANSAALKVSKIDKNTPNVSGGTIERDAKGDATGIFKDNAMPLVEKNVPKPSIEAKTKALMAAMDYVASQGVTSVHHMAYDFGDLQVFRQAEKDSLLKTRIYSAVSVYQWKQLKAEIEQNGCGNEWVKIGALKGFMDGSLGSHTAAFFEPYTDLGNDSGLLTMNPDELFDILKLADKENMQAIVHAIGDKAISKVLDVFEKVQKENPARDRRYRIEHSQHIAPKDFVRYKDLNVIASMQPYHAIDDGRWAEKLIGPERIKTTYAFRTLLDKQVTLAFGSDWFVAPPVPLMGIYAAVTRRTLDEKNPQGWVPEQKITVEDALRAYTSGAAYASFDEKEKGTLEAGKLADFVMLNQDIFTIKPEEIRNAQVLMTITGGKIVYEAK
jgi:predicted amidohydrolase YtcJ